MSDGTIQYNELLSALADAALGEDQGRSIKVSIDRLLGSRVLEELRPHSLSETLISLAEVNLPLARLAEGHVNANQLLERLQGEARGGLLGVWGADGDRPSRVECGRLTGVKRYASGLGIVTDAIISVRVGDATRLAIVPADNPARQRPETWRMTGMRATVSGDFQIDDLEPVWLGDADAYFEEPYFLGGVWRIAALQTGGTLGLLGAVRDHLAELGRLESEAQIARLGPLVARALAARGLVERAAEVAEGREGRNDPNRAVAMSVMARLYTEDLAQDSIRAAERAVGLAHFDWASTSGRRARDLAVYCRQVARDSLEQTAGRIALAGSGRLSELWNG